MNYSYVCVNVLC